MIKLKLTNNTLRIILQYWKDFGLIQFWRARLGALTTTYIKYKFSKNIGPEVDVSNPQTPYPSIHPVLHRSMHDLPIQLIIAIQHYTFMLTHVGFRYDLS